MNVFLFNCVVEQKERNYASDLVKVWTHLCAWILSIALIMMKDKFQKEV